MKHAKHVLTLMVMILGLSLLSGCLEGINFSQYFTPSENWLGQALSDYQDELNRKQERGEKLTDQEKQHLAYIKKATDRFYELLQQRVEAEEKRQPKNPGSGANRPNLASGTGVTSGGISFGCVRYFYSGGSWWPIAMATPADIAKIKAGKVKVSTFGSKIGYVGSGASSGPPRPMLK